MSDLNLLKKLLNNNNLAIPNLYFCGSYDNNKTNNEIIESKILNIDDEKYNKLLDKNTFKKAKKITKKNKNKTNKKTRKKK